MDIFGCCLLSKNLEFAPKILLCPMQGGCSPLPVAAHMPMVFTLNAACTSFLYSLYSVDQRCKLFTSTVKHVIFAASQFWNVEILLHFNFAFSQHLLVFIRPLVGKLDFHGYLII